MTDPISPQRLDEIRAIHAAVTTDRPTTFAEKDRTWDQWAAHSRDYAGDLLAEVDRLTTRITELEAERDLMRKHRAIFRDRLANAVIAARVESETTDGFIAWYLMPTGPIHKAIHELQEYAGYTMRPGFDGRKHERPCIDPHDPAPAATDAPTGD